MELEAALAAGGIDGGLAAVDAAGADACLSLIGSLKLLKSEYFSHVFISSNRF